MGISDRTYPAAGRRWRLKTGFAGQLLASCALAIGLTLAAAAPSLAKDAIGASGLPVPRFVSLKSDRVNIRTGPGTEYPIAWVYRRAGLPVEVVKEFHGWRQIRDSEGATGWIFGAMLSGRRTALVLPWERKAKQGAAARVKLRADDRKSSAVVVVLEAGVLAGLRQCDGNWCEISITSHKGYVEQKTLWGVYPGEKLN